MPTIKVVRDLFLYRDGDLYWRKSGRLAGTICKGYRKISINRKVYAAHRLVWFYVNGTWPDGQIDHIDKDRLNNNIQNLREATQAENARNRGVQANSTSQLKGVFWSKDKNKWQAMIARDGKRFFLGYFADKERAHEAYADAAERMHGEFARVS